MSSKNDDVIKNNRFIKRYIFFAVVVITVFLVIKFINAPYKDVIGLEIFHDGAASSEMRLKYFDDSDIAEKYFDDNNVEKYYIFIKTTTPKAEEWFESLTYPIREDGFKHLGFLGIGDQLANKAASDFLINKSGLQPVIVYEGEDKENNTKDLESNDVYKKEHEDITQEQALEILKPYVDLVEGQDFGDGSIRNIEGKRYYLFIVFNENTVDNGYCVDVLSGEVFHCGEDLKLTPMSD